MDAAKFLDKTALWKDSPINTTDGKRGQGWTESNQNNHEK